MKTICIALFVSASSAIAIANANDSIKDPLQNYLSNFTFYDGRKDIYSDDRLFRLDLDLNNGGQKEVLLSMARDQDGQQGNIWRVYEKAADTYNDIGTVTFSPRQFYLGPIDEIGAYGLVTFGPAGGGEGILQAFVLQNDAIQQIRISSVSRDPRTLALNGREAVQKYLGGPEATRQGDETKIVSVSELAQRYGVSVQPGTYRQVIEDAMARQQGKASPIPVQASTATPGAPPSAHFSIRAYGPSYSGKPFSGRYRWSRGRRNAFADCRSLLAKGQAENRFLAS